MAVITIEKEGKGYKVLAQDGAELGRLERCARTSYFLFIPSEETLGLAWSEAHLLSIGDKLKELNCPSAHPIWRSWDRVTSEDIEEIAQQVKDMDKIEQFDPEKEP